MKAQVFDAINISEMWETFNFPYARPEKLNERESLFIKLKNPAYANDWSLPEFIEGWLYIEGWLDNMIAGEKGRRGATRLQWRPDMGKPIYMSGYSNSNNGASMWFVPKVSIGGDWPWKIRAEIEYTKRGQPEFARLFAEATEITERRGHNERA